MLRKTHLASFAVVGLASLTVISGAHADGYEPAGKAMAAPVADYAWGGLSVSVGIGAASFDHNVGVDALKSKTVEKEKCKEWGAYCYPPTVYNKDFSQSARFGDDDWDVFGSMELAYDHLVHNRFLIGAFVGFDFYPDSESSFSEPLISEPLITYKYGYPKEIGSIDGNFKLDHMWYAGGRLGFLVRPHFLIFGEGGYAEAELDGSVDVTFNNHYGYPTVLSLAAPDDVNGWFVGGGIEHKLSRKVSFRLGYRYTDLDSGSASDSLTENKYWSNCYLSAYCKKVTKTTDFDARAHFDTEIHAVRAAIVLKLVPDERVVAPLK